MNYKKIISIFLVLALAGAIFFYKNTADNTLQSLTISGEITNSIKSEVSSVDIHNKGNLSFRWFKNGYSIIVPATDGFYINKQIDEHLEYEEVPKLFEKELSVAEGILKNRGFVLSVENSSSNFSDETFYDYVQSYQRNDELCVIKINPDDIGYYQFIFTCGNSLNQAYENQLPFLEALNYKNTNNAVHLRNQSGDFYQVGVGSYRGGSSAVFKKENNVYRVLYISQEDPHCEEIENENISIETLELFKINGCYDDEKGYVRFELNQSNFTN